MAALICPSCKREATADDGPMCLNCVRAFIPRPDPVSATQPTPTPPAGAVDSPRTTVDLSAAARCPDPDCPNAGSVPSPRCLACGRSSARIRQSIRFPWGLAEIPADRKLAIGREDSPFARELAGFSNIGRRHATVQSIGNNVVVIDLTSTNGTFVNEERITPLEPRIVSNGDRIRFAASVEAVIEFERPR
jgi:hypothetical protein